MPTWLRQLWLRFKAIQNRAQLDRNLEDELEFHLAMRESKNRAAGFNAEQARYAARRQFGNLSNLKERSREVWTFTPLETFWQDVRHGARILRKNLAFTSLITLTLALGIGANTAIFSMVDWLVLRSLPIQSPRQMIFLAFPLELGNFDNSFSYPEFLEIQKQTADVFSGEAGMIDNGGLDGLTVDRETRPTQCVFVTGNFFSVLGIKPYLGRFILPSEGSASGADPVVVLSYRYWQGRFGGRVDIVGKKTFVNGHPATIVGVAPEGFLGLTPVVETQAYLPLGMAAVSSDTPPDFLNDPEARTMLIFARMKLGGTLAQAQSALEVVSPRIVHQFPRTDARNPLSPMSLRPPAIINGDNLFQRVAALFLTLAVLVSILACVNAANLMLVHASLRQREMAVRAALGAARGRLVRQLLTESVLLALLGCAGGMFIGLMGSSALSSVEFQSESPVVLDFQLNWHVFVYAFGVALVTGFLVAVVPALRVSRGNLHEILHEGGRTSTPGRQRFRTVLVAVQVGGSLTLLIVAGLFVRSLAGVQKADLGFDPQHVVNFSMNTNEIGYNKPQGLSLYSQVLERVRALPGVRSAGLASEIPLGETVRGNSLDIPGYKTTKAEEQPHAHYTHITSGEFTSLGMRLLRGRDFSDADGENSAHVAIINQAMTDRFWPNEDPVGKHFKRGGDPDHSIEIVGVVNNARTTQLYGPFDERFYVPLAQDYSPVMTLQVRTDAAPESMTRSVVDAIHSISPTIPVFGVRTMARALHGLNGLLFFELGAALAGSLGLLGLALAVVGVYGVMSYSVSQRRQEIGIRMALGAQPGEVLAMICRQGGFIVTAGLALGVLVAFAVGRLVRDFLVDVTPSDPLTYVGVSLVLAAVALLAGYLPARRATRVDPMSALRSE
jgi:macrolide transport system ATP-binding/permease protein